VDYRKADPLDPTWWKHWRYLVRAMDDATHEALYQRAYEFQLALVSNSRISAEDFTRVQKAAKELFGDMEGHLRPWLGRTKDERAGKEAETFREQWKAVAGFDPQDREAVAAWGEELRKVTAAAVEAHESAERKAQELLDSFQTRADATLKKRLNQQGRK
jgi:hypothetical protein